MEIKVHKDNTGAVIKIMSRKLPAPQLFRSLHSRGGGEWGVPGQSGARVFAEDTLGKNGTGVLGNEGLRKIPFEEKEACEGCSRIAGEFFIGFSNEL
ncbi:hypothetical protein HNY73_017081 [Argiope bruennichi]|uniref:Uncharacterized protein n=1 Tax=Argiope bruennichi TaxID=94029 RepID=A0A8T0EKG6_ARGBR|nr:hypothetical protein HNY73_017081 [Argiope bruennichi]